ncbi:lipoprotein-anchoring transpeptidase ErfK/SrfK [Bradyrhizobium sp. GM24.11]
MTKFSVIRRSFSPRVVTACAFATALLTVPLAARAQTLGYAPMQPQVYPQDQTYSQGYTSEAPQATDEDAALPDRLRRQIVSFDRNEPAGTIVIDTANTYLYYVLGNGRAIRYGVGVGREGFTWSGVAEHYPQGGMAGLASAGRDDRASALSAALRRRRPRQSARGARDVSRLQRIPHPWHQ